jgi:hypothetical protein
MLPVPLQESHLPEPGHRLHKGDWGVGKNPERPVPLHVGHMPLPPHLTHFISFPYLWNLSYGGSTTGMGSPFSTMR